MSHFALLVTLENSPWKVKPRKGPGPDKSLGRGGRRVEQDSLLGPQAGTWALSDPDHRQNYRNNLEAAPGCCCGGMEPASPSEADMGRDVWRVLWLVWVPPAQLQHWSKEMLQVSSSVCCGVVRGINNHQQVRKIVLYGSCCNCFPAKCYKFGRFG